eukprot:1875602-Pleurochrysis_carterae.AAC.1
MNVCAMSFNHAEKSGATAKNIQVSKILKARTACGVQSGHRGTLRTTPATERLSGIPKSRPEPPNARLGGAGSSTERFLHHLLRLWRGNVE